MSKSRTTINPDRYYDLTPCPGHFPNRYERGDLTSLVRRGLVKSVVSYGVVKKTFYGLTERGRQAAQKEASK